MGFCKSAEMGTLMGIIWNIICKKINNDDVMLQAVISKYNLESLLALVFRALLNFMYILYLLFMIVVHVISFDIFQRNKEQSVLCKSCYYWHNYHIPPENLPITVIYKTINKEFLWEKLYPATFKDKSHA